MAAPVARQSVSLFPTTPQTASTLTLPAWPSATLAGSRIVVLVGVTNNQNDGIGVTASGSYAQVPGSPAVRQANTGAGLHDQVSVRVFERLNAAAAAARPVVSFTGLPGAGVYVWAVAVEVTGSHLTLASNPTGAATGSSVAPSVGPVGPTARDELLWLAAISVGNVQALTLQTGTTYTQVAAGNSGGTAGTGKASGIVARKAQTASGTETLTVDVAGGTAHSFAGLLVAIPAPDAPSTGGGGGGGGTGLLGLDDTNDGRGHFGRTGQYYPAIQSGSGRTALQNAQLIASRCEVVTENVNQADSGQINVDKFSGLADEMRKVRPNILLAPYGKGPQIDEGATYFPNTYYAHEVAWPTGAKIPTGFSPSILRAQPYSPDQPSFNDPRGFTAVSFRDYRARDAKSTLDKYNSIHGAGTLNGWYHDTSGTAAYSSKIADPLHPAQTYDQVYSSVSGGGQKAYLSLVWTIADSTKTQLGTSYIVVMNGLVSGTAYYNVTSGLLDHAHIGYAEAWIRRNYVNIGSSWPDVASWEKSVDMVVHANTVKQRGVWLAVNIENDTAGSAGTGYVAYTTAQINQWRRFSYATYMLAKRFAAWFEFVPTAPTGDYTEDDSWYHVDLGAPLDNPVVSATGRGAAASMKYQQVYMRRYTFGTVFVNPAATAASFTLDKTYYLVDSAGKRSGTLYGASGASKTLAAHDAVIVYTDATPAPNPNAPTVTIISPTTGQTITTAEITPTISATDADGDNIASVEARIGTSGAWTPCVLTGGVWAPATPLTGYTAGSVTVQARATDDNASPLTSTPVQRTFTYAPVTNPAPVNTTPPSLPTDPVEGVEAVIDPGIFTNDPISYAYTLDRRAASGGSYATVYTGSQGTTSHDYERGYVYRPTVVASNGTPSTPAVGATTNPVIPSVDVGLLAVVEADQARVRLTANAGAGATLVTVTRTHPSGRKVIVRSMDQARLSGGVFLGWDYEAPIGRAVTYQATFYSDATTELRQSDPVTITWTTNHDYLKDPLEPIRNLEVLVESMSEHAYDSRTGIHRVLGRAAPITIGEIRSAAAGDIVLITESRDAAERLHYITASGHALLLQSTVESGVGSMYIALAGSLKESRVSPLRDEPTRRWTISYQEVDPPVGDAANIVTYADLLAAYGTYQDVLDAAPTYIELIEAIGEARPRPILAWRGS